MYDFVRLFLTQGDAALLPLVDPHITALRREMHQLGISSNFLFEKTSSKRDVKYNWQ